MGRRRTIQVRQSAPSEQGEHRIEQFEVVCVVAAWWAQMGLSSDEHFQSNMLLLFDFFVVKETSNFLH